MSNRWNQTRAVNRRPKVCLSKHPIPSGGTPAGPCSLTPTLVRRTIPRGLWTPIRYALESLNDPAGELIPIFADPVVIDMQFLFLLNGSAETLRIQPIVGPGDYNVTLTAMLPSGCNPTSTLLLTVTP